LIKFTLLKIWAYLLYTVPVIAPSLYFNNCGIGPVPAAICSLLGGMIALHFVISEDNEQNHKDLKLLIMRKRHFDGR
jgi:hypothetical protein